MGGSRIIKFCLWKACCTGAHCLNVLLAFTAILLTGLVFLNSLQKEIPLPDKLAEWTVHKFMGDEYRATWRSAVFDLRGGVYLDDVEIIRSVTTETVLRARTIQMDWSLSHLIFGTDPVVSEFQAGGINLFIPSHLSPTGLNEPILEIHQVHLLEIDGSIVLENFFMESRGIRVYATGDAPMERIFKASRTDKKSRFDWTAALARLRKLPDKLSADCRVFWNMLPDGTHYLSVRGVSGSLQLPGATLSDLTIQADAQLRNSQIQVSGFHGKATLASINSRSLPAFLAEKTPDLPIRMAFSASGNTTQTGFLSHPERISVSFINPYQALLPADLVILESSIKKEDPHVKFILKGPSLFAAGTAAPIQKADPDSPVAIPFSSSFRAEFHDPKLHGFFPQLPEGRLLKDTRSGYLRLNARSNPSVASGFTGILVCDNLFIGQTLFANIRSDFTVDRSQLDLAAINIQKSHNEFASGSYFHHFPTARFSLNAAGSSFPDSLDTLLGKWWVQIFQNITATKPLPADVTVWGQWTDAESLQSFTAVRGGGASYRGMPIPEMGVKVRSNREWAYLEKLEANFPEGSVTGEVAWAQGIEEGELRPMLLDFRSNARWEAVVAASGVEALGKMTFAGNPLVKAKGVIWQSRREDQQESRNNFIPDLEIELGNPGKSCRIAGLDLGGLSFTGKVSRRAINLDKVSGTFAEGVFAGKIDILNWADEEQRNRRLNLQVFDANYPKALNQLSSLLKNPDPIRKSLTEENDSGRADASFDLLLGPQIRNSEGHGRLTIRDARLGQIHIMGGLSRFLDTLGMGFSTLELDDGSIEWNLEDSMLAIENCFITGPVLRLKIDGSVNVSTKTLNLRAEASLFTGLVSKILTPVSDNFVFDVKGPLSEPIWKLRLNPFRWFQNRIPSGN